jgi:NADP-dependent 3-hydroxy acid dehydrogenase YdfG
VETDLFTYAGPVRPGGISQGATMTKQLTALVTGASSGIGRATTVELARRGHTVFAAARREDVLADLASGNPNARPLGLDVTDPESVSRAWAKVEADTGGTGVDLLVNNAGFALSGPVEVLAGPDVERQFDTNVFGLLNVTRAVLPSMRARRSGRIINVSSVVGRTTFPGMGVYGATKYAVEALSDALRLELAGFGIKVVLIEPGFVATGIGSAADAEPSAAADHVPADYAQMVTSGAAYLQKQTAGGIAPELVAVAIADAAARRAPKARYVVPGSSRSLIALLTTLPDGLADKAKLRTGR